MNEITKQQLLELSHDYVIAWHDVQTHRNGMTHDNLDSSIIVIKMSNIFVGDYRIAADKLLTCPFVELLSSEYAHDIYDILRALNEPYGTSTSLSDEYIDTDEESHYDDQLRLGLFYVIAAAIQVSSNPERFSHDGVAQGLLKPVILNKDVVRYAKGLAKSITKSKDLEIGGLLPLIEELALGGAYGEALAPVDEDTVRVVREISLISKRVFITKNNRTQGRFSAVAIKGILKILTHIGYLDRSIKVRQIRNIQGKLKNDKSKPLTFNQLDIDWSF